MIPDDPSYSIRKLPKHPAGELILNSKLHFVTVLELILDYSKFES